MAKWKIIARPDEEDCRYGLKTQEKIIEADSYENAIRAAWREYPEYHQVGAYKMTKTVRYSITVLGSIEIPEDRTNDEQYIMDRIADDYFECGGDIRFANDVEYEVE